MGFFSNKPRKNGRNGNNASNGQVCPRHGRYNSYVCDDGCRAQIIGAVGQRTEAYVIDDAQAEPNSGW